MDERQIRDYALRYGKWPGRHTRELAVGDQVDVIIWQRRFINDIPRFHIQPGVIVRCHVTPKNYHLQTKMYRILTQRRSFKYQVETTAEKIRWIAEPIYIEPEKVATILEDEVTDSSESLEPKTKSSSSSPTIVPRSIIFCQNCDQGMRSGTDQNGYCSVCAINPQQGLQAATKLKELRLARVTEDDYLGTAQTVRSEEN